jgi:tetratricopeptide (TPR) repeat protein
MFGTPYDMNANIPGFVRKQLRHCYPGVEFEVINWGASAINSNVIRDLVPSLLAFRPDLVLIYMGHNEYYGPDGIGASSLEKALPWLTRLKYGLREYRLVRLAIPLFVHAPAPGTPAPTLMREVSRGQLVRSGSRDEERVLHHFEANLESILTTLREARVPVIVADLASNIMFPPFVADSLKSGVSRDSLSSSMRRLCSGSRYQEILTFLGGLDPADSTNADLLYWKGVALRGLGRPAEARAALGSARDRDLLKFRAPGAINAITDRVCAREGVQRIDGDSVLSACSVDGIAGDTLFWEHLHPTAYGYYQLASAFVRQIIAGRYIPEPESSSRLLPFNSDSLSVCWLDLAYGEYSIRHLTGHWPFENYGRETPILHAADSVLLGMVTGVHARTIAWNEACYAMATYFWRIGRLRDAETTYEAMLEEYPYGFYTNYLEGSLLNSSGRRDEAVRYYLQAKASNPAYLNARLDLGLILVNKGEYDSAVVELQYVQKEASRSGERRLQATANYGLAALCANRGELATAMDHITSALALAPNYTDALRLRAAIASRKR